MRQHHRCHWTALVFEPRALGQRPSNRRAHNGHCSSRPYCYTHCVGTSWAHIRTRGVAQRRVHALTTQSSDRVVRPVPPSTQTAARVFQSCRRFLKGVACARWVSLALQIEKLQEAVNELQSYCQRLQSSNDNLMAEVGKLKTSLQATLVR